MHSKNKIHAHFRPRSITLILHQAGLHGSLWSHICTSLIIPARNQATPSYIDTKKTVGPNDCDGLDMRLKECQAGHNKCNQVGALEEMILRQIEEEINILPGEGTTKRRRYNAAIAEFTARCPPTANQHTGKNPERFTEDTSELQTSAPIWTNTYTTTELKQCGKPPRSLTCCSRPRINRKIPPF